MIEALLGLILAALCAMVWGLFRLTPITTSAIVEHMADGVRKVVHIDVPFRPASHSEKGLRPYVVREDGAIEFSDGEVVFPNKPVTPTPAMRLVD